MTRTGMFVLVGLLLGLVGCDTAVKSGDQVVDDAIVYHADGTSTCPFCGEEIDLTDEFYRVPLCTNKDCQEEVRLVGREIVCSDCGGSGSCAMCLGTGVGEHYSSCRCTADGEAGECPVCDGTGFILLGDTVPEQDKR